MDSAFGDWDSRLGCPMALENIIWSKELLNVKGIVMWITRDRMVLALLITGPIALGGTVHSAEQPPVATQNAQQLIDGLCKNYERWLDLPGFEVQYRLVGEELAAESSYAWGWGWGEFTNIIKPKDHAKMYVRWKHPAYPKDYKTPKGSASDPKVRDAICVDIGSADGTMFISLEEKPHADGPKGLVATLMPLSNGKQFVIHNTYYFDFLAYPANLDPEDGITERGRFIKGAYWLPAALRDNAKSYLVRPVCEKVGEDWCHVLERPGVDIIWVQQKESGCALRRRASYWNANGPIRQDVACDDPVEVDKGLWLPRKVRMIRHGSPWDKAPIIGKPVWALHLTVSKLSADPVPNSIFRPDIPKGAIIVDAMVGQHPTTFVNKPNTNPYERAAEILQQQETVKWRRMWLLLSVGGILLILVLLLGWRMRQHLIWRNKAT
jgi:hypothetical protein